MEQRKKVKKILSGVVLNTSGQKSIRVRVEVKYPHPKYSKIIKTHKNYLVHVETEVVLGKGDIVEITPCRPMSKKKSWILVNKIESKK